MRYSIDQQALNKAINDLEKKSDNALEYCGEYLQSKIQEQLKLDSYDLWNLARSVAVNKVRHWLVEVWSALVYAPIREYGRQPWKFPNLDALVCWTARKGMITWWATQRYDDLYYKDKWTIFVIARAIAKRWIKWKHTFENVLNRERDNIKKLYIQKMQEW